MEDRIDCTDLTLPDLVEDQVTLSHSRLQKQLLPPGASGLPQDWLKNAVPTPCIIGDLLRPFGGTGGRVPTSLVSPQRHPAHSTCENHAYAATQLVRKRQRANQEASGSPQPTAESDLLDRRADARGILEAEEGGEEL
ncbi:hypothetical protein MG293_013673 [Ovis ammon polii]|uniref:Uncharacterized protein n=1 Tax=Ovis ammon polii TaxID=230172 RepID=A0AAD4U0K5_OVIAM|nr:hypothetical protein MG293_013673 [Ovis ammon polii]